MTQILIRLCVFSLYSLLLLPCLPSLALPAPGRSAPAREAAVVPRPVSQITPAGEPGFRLSSSLPVIVVVPAAQRAEVCAAAERFARWARPVVGSGVRVRTEAAARARQAILLTNAGVSSSLNREGYTLSVRSTGITISARQPAGFFYGLQTLRQLFPPIAESGQRVPPGFVLPAVSITDQPRFPVRSVMLDSARHLQSIGFLKKTIDQMAYHKLNRFHWHLSDDQGWRLEIKKYPKLTSVGAWRMEAGGRRYGGFYTQAQVRDLVAYARERYVTIQPEIDMPAHIQSALAAYPELACFPKPFIVSTAGVSANGVGSPEVLCVSKPNSFRFVTDVLTEVMALFPSKEIHIGGDECDKTRWKACPVCQERIRAKGLKNETALQNDFTQRLAAFLQSRGRRLQGWNEIEEGGPLPNNVVVHLWNDPTTLERSSRAEHDIIYSYKRTLYLDQDPASLTPERVYATEPLPAGASAMARKHLLGLEACLWTERRDGDKTTDDYLWPRVAALAEAAWTPTTRREWENFRTRMTGTHLHRMARISVGEGAAPQTVAMRWRHLYENGALAVGAEAGSWEPSMMSETEVTREWEITKFLDRPGLWGVQPQYVQGAHGIAVSEISLVRRAASSDSTGDGTVIATDRHEAWAGTDVRNARFRLPVPRIDSKARYFLRIRLRSDGGT
ncbi:MAG: beta-N-acetylhexosaminidase, partial [Armatimonadota bacterium]